MHRRLRWAALAPVLVLGTSACQLPGTGGPRAVLEIDEPVVLTWVAEQSYEDASWGLTITNTSAVDDTAPPQVIVDAPPGVEVVMTQSPNIPCTVALEAGEECAVLLELSGSVTQTVTGSVTVTGGSGTQGDTETITIHAV